MPNSVEYIIAYFACWKLGALAGPVNSLLKAQEISYVLSNSEAKAVLIHPEFQTLIDGIFDELPNLQAVILFDDEAKATRDVGEVLPATPPIDRDHEAIIIYTSGTTGRPKGCLLTHGNLIANARQISQWLGFNEHDRLLTVMPLFHMNAVSVTTMAALYAGGSTVVPAALASWFSVEHNNAEIIKPMPELEETFRHLTFSVNLVMFPLALLIKRILLAMALAVS